MARAARAHPVLNAGIFPTLVDYCWPSTLATADCGQICRGGDGCNYVIKEAKAGAAIPHSEWFCTELGERIGIPAPAHKVMDMRDGTLAFGSRWAGGIVRPAAGGFWYDLVKAGTIKLSDIQDVLSRVYAFDQFISNRDRHRNNFIIHDQDPGYALLANDYSRAWLCHGFPLAPGPLAACNTVSDQRWLSSHWGQKYIDATVVSETVARIEKITKVTIRRIIDDSPSIWLPPNKKADILSWWGSPDMKTRLAAIEKGVMDGTYL